MKICQFCLNEFEKPKTYSSTRWAKTLFCSLKCAYGTRQKVTLVCKECTQPFTVKNYRKNTAHFCSQDCSHKNRNQGLTPKNEMARKVAAYKAWRTLVFERDNYTCQVCGIRGDYLHADHIKPFAYYPELRYEVTNGRTLCVPCHKKTDTYGVKAWRSRVATC